MQSQYYSFRLFVLWDFQFHDTENVLSYWSLTKRKQSKLWISKPSGWHKRYQAYEFRWACTYLLPTDHRGWLSNCLSANLIFVLLPSVYLREVFLPSGFNRCSCRIMQPHFNENVWQWRVGNKTLLKDKHDSTNYLYLRQDVMRSTHQQLRWNWNGSSRQVSRELLVERGCPGCTPYSRLAKWTCNLIWYRQ